ncbi:MAG: GNAT family protein [Actinobacteria bacterium]|nr:GNAT family protein [Actinomycetota bacterium]
MIWWPSEIPTLQDGLITLRPAEESDALDVYEACQDPLIALFTTLPTNYTREHAASFYTGGLAGFDSRREIRFVITHGYPGEEVFCGVISFHSVDLNDHGAEIGYWMAAPMRGKGIGTRAVKALTHYGFTAMGFRRIEGLVDAENKASQALLLSAGYQFEATLRKKVTRDDGRQVDMVLFSAIDDQWTSL